MICEYNPLHNGHIFMLGEMKRRTDNAVCAIMSGSFTQRGDVAITDKFTRARLAAENGADLVVELPTVYATASAQVFARAGVEIADSLGCADELCFGCETADLGLLQSAVDAMESESFNASVREFMKSGDYYPQAVEKALGYDEKLSELISKPNNILAVEYIKALKSTKIAPRAIERKGSAHDSSEVDGNIASASYIRSLILSGNNFSELIPHFQSGDFEYPADIKRLEKTILYKLRTMTTEELALLPDVGEGLENRIYEAARASCSLEGLLNSVKTKRYTHARLRRIIISALLGITADLQKQPVPYIRVLAFNDKGSGLLGEISRNERLPLITNVSDGYKKLSGYAKRIFDVDLTATDLHSLATQRIRPCGEDFTQGIIKV